MCACWRTPRPREYEETCETLRSVAAGQANAGMIRSWIRRSWVFTSVASGRSRPVNDLTRVRSVIAQIMWWTPLGAISRRIFSAHSSGVPAMERRSAISGVVSQSLGTVVGERRVADLHGCRILWGPVCVCDAAAAAGG